MVATTSSTRTNHPRSDFVSAVEIDTSSRARRSQPSLYARSNLPASRQLQQQQQLPTRRNSSNTNSIILPRWQPDEEASRCSVCGAWFGFFLRKHHCRKCGKIVCYSCSQHRITIPRQFIVHPPPTSSSSPFAVLAGREVAPAPLTTSTQLQHDTPWTREDNEEGRGLSRSLSHESTGSDHANLSAAEVVRVCNPCVPDPNLSPPPQQESSPAIPPPPLFPDRTQSRNPLSGPTYQGSEHQPFPLSRAFRHYGGNAPQILSSDSSQLRRGHIVPSEILSHHRRESGISGSRTSLRTSQDAQTPGTRSRLSHNTASEQLAVDPHHGRNISPPTGYYQQPPQNVSGYRSSRHRYHHSTGSSQQRTPNLARTLEGGAGEITRSSGGDISLPSTVSYASVQQPGPLYLSNASSSGSSSASPPRYRSMRTPSQRVRPAQTQVREEDECPVCGQELPPRGPDENEDNRVRHVEGCISLYSSSMSSSAPLVSSATPPDSQPQIQSFSPANQTAGTNTASPTNEAIGSSSGASNILAGVSQMTIRPRRATGNRMLIYHATEKDCLAADGEVQECVICFEEFAVGDEMGRLECLCKFHRMCIRQWWDTKGAGSCPTHQLHQ